MTNIIYQDVIDACLLAAQKLYKTREPNCKRTWRVRIDGATAGIRKDDRTIDLTLPFLPLDARLTREERDLWIGYVLHELGHTFFTDFTAWRMAVHDGLHDLVNGLEDPRIEAQVLTCGVATNARALLENLTNQKLSENLAAGYTPANMAALSYTLAVYGRAALGFNIAAPALDKATESALAWIWPRLEACANTFDVLALARDVDAWRKTKQDDQGAQGNGAQDQDDQDDQDKQDAQDQDQGDQDQGDDQDKQDDQDDDQDDQDDAQDSVNGKGGANDQDAPQAPAIAPGVEPNLDKQAEEILKRCKPRPIGQDGADMDLASIPRTMPKLTEKTKRLSSMDNLDKLFPSTAKLKADLTRLVKSPAKIDTQHGLLSGRLDRRAFGRIAGGATNVFARRQFTEGTNAAVAVVLDGSGSMKGMGETFAAAMAIAIGDAMDRAAVPFEISRTGRAAVGRGDPVIDIMKPYAVAWRKRRDMVPMMAGYDGTCNLVGAMAAAGRLKQVRGVTRRILFVLSDGMDCYSNSAWIRAQQLWERDGIETIGIGLLHNVGPVFKEHVNVYDPHQLAREGLGLLSRKLRAAA
jgi:hypothetical protein